MLIKIYYGKALIYITDSKSEMPTKTVNGKSFKVIEYPGKKEIKKIVDQFTESMSDDFLFVVKDSGIFFEELMKFYSPIRAAGGIVQNGHKDVLFIFRLGRWDLPKGKIEKGEKAELAAAREITEETGIENLHLTGPICDSFHIYIAFGKTYLKTTHWFHFNIIGAQQPIPQQEENITVAQWIPKKEIAKPMTNTYENIRNVISAYFDKP